VEPIVFFKELIRKAIIVSASNCHIEVGEQMNNNNLSQQARKSAQVRKLFETALVLGFTLCAVTGAPAQKISNPITPIDITPPSGNTAFLVGHAVGTQGYMCLPTSAGGTSWTVNPARPEATLFASFGPQWMQVITHFTSIDANPNKNAPDPVPLSGNVTWQSSFDTSKVWAKATGTIGAGSDASCPNAGAIPCLRLESIGNQEGPMGGKLLANVSFIQRLNTRGGSAPTTACSVGQTELVPYTADYFFFRADK
jgi:hypothetical protein